MAASNKARHASHDSPGIDLPSSLGSSRAARSETFGFIATPPRRTWRPDIRTLRGSHRADGVEETPIFDHTFANFPGPNTQNYPVPGSAPDTGAATIGSLGYVAAFPGPV